ncbi:MAG: (d)CMP kinase [Alphaproteobacteria bacterium]|nr:(d)CMP kinase [Alphaproteobacteria bacterium]OJV47814.1 MAG: cytidylate kinase [Alphaproteobacteria bacterium 43-37]
MLAERVVAIDGPSASGKGTLARRVAAEYGWRYFDSGLLYRALAWLCHENQIVPELNTKDDWRSLASQIDDIVMDNDSLRFESVGQLASQIASIPNVREALLQFQRNLYASLPAGQWLVMDGRDIGTVIFPKASIKLFLIASAEARTHRRLLEMQEKGVNTSYEQLLNDIYTRDMRDVSRTASPLHQAPDALVIDTSTLSADDVFKSAQEIIDNFGKKTLTS